MSASRVLNAKNLKYAVGEVFLIVVGVSLALMANAWYQNLKDRREELLSLQQLQIAIQSDIASVEVILSDLRRAETQLSELYDALQGGEELFDGDEGRFNALTSWSSTQSQTGPYEEIKNRGFSLISNASLRTALIDLYEVRLPALETVVQADIDFTSAQVRPYFNTHFSRLRNGTWAPIEGYSALQSDVLLRNLVLDKLRRSEGFYIPICERYIAAAQNVLEELDAHITRLTG